MTEMTVLKQDFLFEIGTEELPPKALPSLAKSFETQVLLSLKEAELKHGEVKLFYAPRRIALQIDALEAVQPDKQIERRGPSIAAAYDQNGKPTKACEGFLKSCGVTLKDCETLKTDKGEWLVYHGVKKGVQTKVLLPAITQQALQNLPIPKMMRWADNDFSFVRPVHWLVMLFGNEIIPATLFGVETGKQTYGHRIHHSKAIQIDSPRSYADQLKQVGHVMADPAERLALIQKQIEHIAAGVNGTARLNDDLLSEVNNIVEWPEAMLANFDKALLKVPQEALISSMQSHQKSFAIIDQHGKLLPHFIFVSNIQSKDPRQVIKGNEKVMSARLNDARFFYEQDLKTPLMQHLSTLGKVTFQKQLGSIADQVKIIQAVAVYIAKQIKANDKQVTKAAELAKCDLMTAMVGEFPELQGIMGKYYALAEGEDRLVAQAIEDHYKPNFAGDVVPESDIGACVALADKLATLVGIIGIGQKPSGTKDPYKLRRAAIGVLRILIEKNYALNLNQLLLFAAEQYQNKLKEKDIAQTVQQYILERLKVWYQSHDISPEIFESVMACEQSNLVDIDQRIQAVKKFTQLPEAAALIAANKRVGNILKSVHQTKDIKVDQAVLVEPAEEILYSALAELTPSLTQKQVQADYVGYLTLLAQLKDQVDAFFDNIRVMDDDTRLKANRIALLQQLQGAFNGVADLAQCQSS